MRLKQEVITIRNLEVRHVNQSLRTQRGDVMEPLLYEQQIWSLSAHAFSNLLVAVTLPFLKVCISLSTVETEERTCKLVGIQRRNTRYEIYTVYMRYTHKDEIAAMNLVRAGGLRAILPFLRLQKLVAIHLER